MKNSHFFCLCISLFFSCWTQAQIKVSFSKKAQSILEMNAAHPETKNINGQIIELNRSLADQTYQVIPLYTFSGKQIYYRGKTHTITPPKKLKSKDNAFGFLYFTGRRDEQIPYTTLIFIEAYRSASPKVYVDYNHNLDLSDDGSALKVDQENHSVWIKLKNQENPKVSHQTELFFPGAQMPPIPEKTRAYFQALPDAEKNKILAEEYWLREVRHNYLLGQVKINEQNFRVGLVDWNVNGKFNDPSDRILEPDAQSGFLSPKLSHGASLLQDSLQITLNNQNYQIIELEPRAKYLKLQEVEMPKSTLKNGDQIPNFSFKSVDGSKTNLYAHLKANTFTIISVWGTWSKDFKEELPKLKQVASDYSNKVQLIGFNARDMEDRRRDKVENIEWVQKYVQSNQMNWFNAFADRGVLKELRLERFFTYILLDPDKKIVDLSLNLEELKGILSQLK